MTESELRQQLTDVISQYASVGGWMDNVYMGDIVDEVMAICAAAFADDFEIEPIALPPDAPTIQEMLDDDRGE